MRQQTTLIRWKNHWNKTISYHVQTENSFNFTCVRYIEFKYCWNRSNLYFVIRWNWTSKMIRNSVNCCSKEENCIDHSVFTNEMPSAGEWKDASWLFLVNSRSRIREKEQTISIWWRSCTRSFFSMVEWELPSSFNISHLFLSGQLDESKDNDDDDDDDGESIDQNSHRSSLIFRHGQKYFFFFALNRNNSNNKKMNVKKEEEIVS